MFQLKSMIASVILNHMKMCADMKTTALMKYKNIRRLFEMINDVDKFTKARIRIYYFLFFRKVKKKPMKLQKLRLKWNGRNACFSKMINRKKYTSYRM